MYIRQNFKNRKLESTRSRWSTRLLAYMYKRDTVEIIDCYQQGRVPD